MAAFVVVYDEVAPRLERFLRRHLREKAAIEDLIQQTFLQMHGARGSFIVGAEVLPWAFAIARRLMIDLGRQSKARHEECLEMDGDELAAGLAAPDSSNAEELMDAQETRSRLVAAFGQLSGPQRSAFELVKSEGLSHAEAATILGTTVSGIKLRLHRSYLALRAALSEPALTAAVASVGPGVAAAKLLAAEERR
ncbi:MAG TPA: RNA polymerase sigma factor [Polyangia bacterium]|jgi:RNA polymerase sigma-70 factor (ECF subfamily)|nr:RNA polymerase sigma factor [Polyangia bacterium]